MDNDTRSLLKLATRHDWLKFWSGDSGIFILFLLGITIGALVGNSIEDWARSFPSIEIYGYPIPRSISSGAIASLAVQIASVISI